MRGGYRRDFPESVAPSELVQVVQADDNGVTMYEAVLDFIPILG